MIKEFRNGLFGLGLITGIALTLIFSAALDWPSPNSEEVSAPLANQVEGNLLAVEDLKAQMSMAVSADRMLNLTEISLVLGAVSAIAIFWTLMETRRGVRVSQEIGFSDRAWITPEGVKQGIIANELVNGVQCPIVYTIGHIWKNSGRSPALNLDTWIEQRKVMRDDPMPSFSQPMIGLRYTVGPGGTVNSDGMTINQD